MYAWAYLTDKAGDEQQNKHTVVISTRPQEAVWHEGRKQGHVPIGLAHFHLPQLHLNGLEDDSTTEQGCRKPQAFPGQVPGPTTTLSTKYRQIS